MIPDFRVHKAARAFTAAYGDDPNVVAIDPLITGAVRVTLRDTGEGWFPTAVDGVPLVFVPATESAREAS